MTAAKTRSGAVPAKGKPAKSAPAKRTTPAAAPAKAATPKPAAAKSAAKRPPPPAAKAGATKPKSAPATATKPTAAKVASPAPAARSVATAAPTKAAPAKTPAKSVTVKSASPGRKGRGDSGSEANLHKRVDSERIAQHIAAFEKSGGRVEKLGVTRVLQKVSEAAPTAPAQASKTGGRRR